MNLKVSSPVVKRSSSEDSSYSTVSTSPVQVAFSLGAYPAGSRIKPLALPFSSVTISPLNADREFPAIPVNLKSGLTQRLTFLPSRNTETLVRGLSLPITNLIGLVLAKNCSDVDTTFSPTVLV